MKKLFLPVVFLLLFASLALGQGTISGTVFVEGSGDPLNAANVLAFNVNSDHPTASVQTGPDGTYVLQVPFGEYHVRSIAQDYYPEWYNNAQHRSEATAVIVAEGHNPEGIDFSLAGFQHEGGSISGRIIEEGTDNGIPMANVTATRIEGEPFERSSMSVWGGAYSIQYLPPGPYVVTAHKWGWNEGAYPETLIVNNNSFEHIDIFLAQGSQDLGSIAGVITDAATGEPIANAFIIARGDNHFNNRFALSGADGSYTIGDLHQDTYHVVAHKEGYFPGEYPDPIVIDGNDVVGIDIALSGMVPTGITGNVTDGTTGEPIPEALITAVNVDNHRIHMGTHTGPDGAYVLTVPPGEYFVQARAWGYAPQNYPDNVIVPVDGFVENIDFALLAIDFGSISGTVTDTAGDPIANAIVRARPADGFHRWRYTHTGEDGAYTFENVLPGSYIVRAFKYGFNPGIYPDTVIVENGQDVTGIDIVLQPYDPPFDGYISGTITDEATGGPIANAMVLAFGFGRDPDHRNWFHRRAFTAEDGSYTLENLPGIEFRLFAIHPDYIGEFYDNVQRYSEATPVTPNAEGIGMALALRIRGLRSLSGELIVDGQNQPEESIVYATVDGEIVDISVSDIDGFYSFNDLDIGEYEISAFSIFGEGELGYIADLTFGDLEGADIVLSPTSTDDGSELLPTSNTLSQNYPNPFNGRTLISFNVLEAAEVELSIFNVVGQKVATLVDGVYQAGAYQVTWNGLEQNGQAAASGIYYYKLTAGSFSETMRMTLLK